MDYALGEEASALDKLKQALSLDPGSFAALHAQAEILFSCRRFDEALEAAEKACSIQPDDIHIHTTLSRIWMEKGDKESAERHGAEARRLSWKEELKEPPSSPGGLS